MMDNTCLNIAVLIVNSIAALAAVGAAIIAVIVYRKTAEQQHKAINYSLLDSKLQLWKYFEHDITQPKAIISKILNGRDWQVEKFKLLFGIELFEEYCLIEAKKEELNSEETSIYSIEKASFPVQIVSEHLNDETNLDILSTIRKTRKKVLEDSATNEDWIAFKTLCSEHFANEQYYNKVYELGKSKKELNKREKAFLKKIENDIISSINEKGENSK